MRGKPAPKREIEGDIKYNDKNVAKIINYIMKGGKKTAAEKIVYGCFDFIKDKTKQDPRHVFNKALKRVSPIVEIRGKRVGGANYQVPQPVRPDRKIQLAFRWIINAAKAKKGKPMAEKLAEELMLAVNNEGAAIKKKLDTHRMAEANRAFAHFSW